MGSCIARPRQHDIRDNNYIVTEPTAIPETQKPAKTTTRKRRSKSPIEPPPPPPSPSLVAAASVGSEPLDDADTAATIAPEKKKKSGGRTPKQTITLLLKRQVWGAYIGEDIGRAKCLCCGMTDITQLSFHCGHVVAEARGGTLTVDNLRPICQSCNCSMGARDMREYMAAHGRTLPEAIPQ